MLELLGPENIGVQDILDIFKLPPEERLRRHLRTFLCALAKIVRGEQGVPSFPPKRTAIEILHAFIICRLNIGSLKDREQHIDVGPNIIIRSIDALRLQCFPYRLRQPLDKALLLLASEQLLQDRARRPVASLLL